MKFFKFKNWSGLTKHSNNYSDFLDLKRNILFSQFCIIAALAALVQGVYDLIEGFPYVTLIDISIAVLLIVGYILNERRRHRTAKVLVISMANILLFIFASIVPKEIGIYLLFYPLVVFTFIVLDVRKVKYSYGLSALTLLLFIILMLTDYQPFGEINIQPIDPTGSYLLNVIISVVLLSLGINFMLSINFTSEKILLDGQKKAEDLAQKLKDRNNILIESNEELDRFVYSTSHDLKAPLASIKGLVNLAEIESDPKLISGYIELIKGRTDHLEKFIQDILDYSRNERMDVIYCEVDLKALVDDVIENNRYLENADQINLINSVDIKSPVIIDQNRVLRVLNNLVSNAVKYNDINYPSPAVEVLAEQKDDNLIIKVSDTGKGINIESKDKIFDMFYRGTENVEGTGIGLYITREMVTKMNGIISFEDRKQEGSQGTTFTVSIPMHEAS